jgi:REP element-mobilizing transposase RayT
VEQAHQRKTIRLDREVYQKAGQPFSITVCTYNKTSLSNKLEELIFQSIIEGDLRKKSNLMAVCVMPDHVHLLLAPVEENLIEVIGRWKSYTTHLIQLQESIVRVWQRSFYDPGLRKDEDLIKVAEYIVSNPVRKGLVEDWANYPFAWHKWMQNGDSRGPPCVTKIFVGAALRGRPNKEPTVGLPYIPG